MAETKKKSKAQNLAAGKTVKKPASKAASTAKNKEDNEKVQVPVRLITSVVCLGLFLVFLVMALQPEGALIGLLLGFVRGLVGHTAFYVAIPALLYLFIIQAFSGKKPVILRSVSLIVFVVLCGCISQLFLEVPKVEGFAILAELYKGGVDGTSAGLLCGGIGLLLDALLGFWISMVILVVAAVLLLLTAFNITIASIIRAVQNRPRADWEDEDAEIREEPAAVVVNHIANKRIEHMEQRRQRRAEREELEAAAELETPAKKKKPRSRASELMQEIDGDVDTPVAAAENPVAGDEGVDIIVTHETKPAAPVPAPAETVPYGMPPLEPDEEIPAGPILEEPAPAPVPVPAPTPVMEKVTAKDAAVSAAEVAAEIAEAEIQPKVMYCFPPIDLLTSGNRASGDGTAEMRENTRRLNETLESFKIEAHIVNVTRGPSVTRYEVELDKGVRLNKLTTC
ncbi:MAG: hypothetical protein E7436_08460, partial [Ruminococcaceae bacterium]|nr:hypothetical protein [Oscillospiraceae bacterium]